MQALTKDINAVVAALRKSDRLVVSDDGKFVRRLKPLPEVDDSKDRTVYVVTSSEISIALSLLFMYRKDLTSRRRNLKTLKISSPPLAKLSVHVCAERRRGLR